MCLERQPVRLCSAATSTKTRRPTMHRHSSAVVSSRSSSSTHGSDVRSCQKANIRTVRKIFVLLFADEYAVARDEPLVPLTEQSWWRRAAAQSRYQFHLRASSTMSPVVPQRRNEVSVNDEIKTIRWFHIFALQPPAPPFRQRRDDAQLLQESFFNNDHQKLQRMQLFEHHNNQYYNQLSVEPRSPPFARRSSVDQSCSLDLDVCC